METTLRRFLNSDAESNVSSQLLPLKLRNSAAPEVEWFSLRPLVSVMRIPSGDSTIHHLRLPRWPCPESFCTSAWRRRPTTKPTRCRQAGRAGDSDAGGTAAGEATGELCRSPGFSRRCCFAREHWCLVPGPEGCCAAAWGQGWDRSSPAAKGARASRHPVAIGRSNIKPRGVRCRGEGRAVAVLPPAPLPPCPTPACAAASPLPAATALCGDRTACPRSALPAARRAACAGTLLPRYSLPAARRPAAPFLPSAVWRASLPGLVRSVSLTASSAWRQRAPPAAPQPRLRSRSPGAVRGALLPSAGARRPCRQRRGAGAVPSAPLPKRF